MRLGKCVYVCGGGGGFCAAQAPTCLSVGSGRCAECAAISTAKGSMAQLATNHHALSCDGCRVPVLQLDVVDPGTVLMLVFGGILLLLWLLFLCYGEAPL